MSTKIKIEPYLSNPIFALIVGLLLVGFGFFAMRIAVDDLLFFILVWILTICGFSAAVYGFMGIVEGKRKQIKGNSQEVRSLSQSLKVSYPTYILKVHKLKEKYEALHEKFPEVRSHSEEFKRRIKASQAALIGLETQVTLYHELLTACTSEISAFEAILALKQEVEEIDTLLLQHEAELQKLETNTQTRYELSQIALSMFQERFEVFKIGCEEL